MGERNLEKELEELGKEFRDKMARAMGMRSYASMVHMPAFKKFREKEEIHDV